MKFYCRVVIDAPIKKVIHLFDDPDNLNKWQDSFISLEHLEGIPGQPGAKSRLTYKIGNREIELTETIVKKNLPSEFSALYEIPTMTNKVKNSFSTIDIHQTEYIVEVEYTEIRGFIPKLTALLMPGIFKKQTQKWLDQFKVFVESTE